MFLTPDSSATVIGLKPAGGMQVALVKWWEVCRTFYSHVRALRDADVKRSVTDLAAGAAKRCGRPEGRRAGLMADIHPLMICSQL